jgi:uncharacterized protein (TIGR03067 family)
MKTALTIITALALFMSIALGVEGTNDLSVLQGIWVIETATEDGNTVSPVLGSRFTFKDDKLIVQMKDGKVLHCKVKILPSTSLSRISIEPDPPNGCKSRNNAFRNDGDTLTLVQAHPPKEPIDLSDKGQQRYVLRRQTNE